MSRDLVGMEEVKAKLRKDDDLEHQRAIIKSKTSMEKDYRRAIR